MAFTSTLCGANSADSALVIAMPAARDTEVGMLFGRGALAPMLSTLMMRPQRRSFICGDDQADEADRGEQLLLDVVLQDLVGHLLERHRRARCRRC